MEGKDFVNTLQTGREIRKPPPVFKKRSESHKWLIISIIGIIIVFLGSVWVTTAQWTPPPNVNDYHSLQHYKEDKMAWENATQAGNLYGRIVIELGAMVMVIGGFAGFMASLDDYEKKAFLVLTILGVTILVIVSVGLFTASPYH